ncbi:MAG: hypothetical protein ACOCXI_07945 [Chloroflexota bacterium]
MNRKRVFQLLPFLVLILVLAVLMATSSSLAAGPDADPDGIARAIAAQDANADALLNRPGVVGVAVGLQQGAQPTIRLYVVDDDVAGLPAQVEGIPVETVVTGMFYAYQTTDRHRPAPIGVSVGHPDITAGTIGARVVDGGGNVYALSNNHVLANSNDAQIGDSALQPGPYDGGTDPEDKIGELHDFEPILFDGSDNIMDAAIASSTTAELDNATLPEGYGVPGSTVVDASIGLDVQKCGRTTECTTGEVAEINATIEVCYEPQGPFCAQLGRFVDQITITPGDFSAGGDSGSLIVTDDGNNNPVGLLFAGSDTRTIANPIGPVLDRFNVSIDDSTGSDPDPTATPTPTPTSDPDPTPTPTATPEPDPGDITLSATAYKVRGLQKADLEWSGADSTDVDVYRDGELITTTTNDGFYTDNIDQRGSGSYTYQVCEAGTSTCSNEAQIDF